MDFLDLSFGSADSADGEDGMSILDFHVQFRPMLLRFYSVD